MPEMEIYEKRRSGFLILDEGNKWVDYIPCGDGCGEARRLAMERAKREAMLNGKRVFVFRFDEEVEIRPPSYPEVGHDDL